MFEHWSHRCCRCLANRLLLRHLRLHYVHDVRIEIDLQLKVSLLLMLLMLLLLVLLLLLVVLRLAHEDASFPLVFFEMHPL
jgi:hypothetical protein